MARATEVEELRAEVQDLQKQLGEARAEIRKIQAERDDHPNTSWGGLYADRDRWRAKFYVVARAVMIDGVSLLEWRDRALRAEKALEKLKTMVAGVAA